MLSPEMLKSQFPIKGGGWVGLGEGWWPTFDAESRIAKITNSHLWRVEEGIGSQLLMLSPKMLKSKIHISWVDGLEGWWWPTFYAESKNAKIQHSNFHRWVKGEGGAWQPTFDAEFKIAKIQNSHFHRWGGGCWRSTFDAESRIAKITNSHLWRFGRGDWQRTFDAESKNAKIQNSHFHGWMGWRGGGGQLLC